MMVKDIALLCLWLPMLACACTQQDDTGGKRPAALSLPRRPDSNNVPPQVFVPIEKPDIPAAMERSTLVVSGQVQTVDSTIHGHNRAPFYLVGIKVQHVWKGATGTGALLYYMSRKLPVFNNGDDQIFFLSPVDPGSVFATSARLHWEWTPGAPPDAPAANFPRYLVSDIDSGRTGTKEITPADKELERLKNN